MHIRPLLPRDWDDVSAILVGSLGPGALDDEPPTWDQFNDRYLPGHRLVAASREGRITGWAALEAVSPRRAFSGVAAVSVFVDAAYRGQGFGRHLLSNLITASEEAGFWTLEACILATNTAAAHLFEDLGFRTVGRQERLVQVDGAWHDTVLLEHRSAVVFPEAAPPTQEIPEAS
ncbi:MAG: GNAT family N-acetyltransferase [Bifidobacteriaceae bacterium]|jgi:phosphinothricin acetyltransferase|nr:GNAT family N-acetyltransferase [Bifidobacteriaceae bacterium]